MINQNTIGQERDCHEFRGHLSQLAVYKIEKSDEEISFIEDILKGQANFEYKID